MVCVISSWIAVGLYSMSVRGYRVAYLLVEPELPVFLLRFVEFGRVRWFGHPVQYVEPGVHLAKLLQPLQTTGTTYGVRPGL